MPNNDYVLYIYFNYFSKFAIQPKDTLRFINDAFSFNQADDLYLLPIQFRIPACKTQYEI